MSQIGRGRDQHVVFFVRNTRNFERFHYFNFETNFLKNKNFSKKPEYRFLVASTRTENAMFPYKITLSEPDDKT